MNVNISAAGLLLAAGGLLVAYWYLTDSTPSAINPTSRDNVIYKGFNAIGDIFDDGQDNDSYNLGSSAYDFLHDPKSLLFLIPMGAPIYFFTD